ncbi:MAG: Hcp family type VI secretion system effector [Deltaproteobacteria bacterium]|nr:MAG: Hcp family type VI secretion system effector [Deltaproteobacteria bacterium]
MPMPIHMTLKGKTTGEIKGGCTQRGREDSIIIFAFDHEIISPRDIASGLPTGKRQHKPLLVTKEIDKSSPLLYTVLCSNETLTEVVFKFWKPSASGKEIQYYTIRLTNAYIAARKTYFPNMLVAENTKLPHLEEVSFTYQKIEWTFEEGGISFEDDWEAPVV